ncbi:MAG: response regulator [Oscillospiraceae bacterium]|nr:response regulator [Oscillospiraceae bacterium]
MTNPIKERGKKRVLAVDDAAIILSRITDALRKHYDVITVNSGSRALKYLDSNKPDLILLDIRMPIRDGFEILREIQTMEDRADIPVIMLTGMESKRYVMEGINLGIRDYVLKPFAPDDLLERVQRVLEPEECGHDGQEYQE